MIDPKDIPSTGSEMISEQHRGSKMSSWSISYGVAVFSREDAGVITPMSASVSHETASFHIPGVVNAVER
jgi:hypothetical protein